MTERRQAIVNLTPRMIAQSRVIAKGNGFATSSAWLRRMVASVPGG